MLTIVTLVTGNVVLTLAIVIGFIYFISKLGDWVNKHCGTRTRWSSTTRQPSTADDTRQPREKTDSSVYSTNLIQRIHQCCKAREQADVVGVNPMQRTVEKQKEQRNAECHNANVKRPSLLSLLRHIVSYCKQRVNESGKEPADCT